MAEIIRYSRRGSARVSNGGGVLEIARDGTFEGYASLFGVPDNGRDVIARGAFRTALKRRGQGGVKMLYQHAAAEPIGTWSELYEDAVGLFVRGRITPDVQKAREVLALLRDGAIDGLSVGFKTKRARTDAKSGVRVIYEADLWEVSVVTFPMLDGARVTRVTER